MGMRFSSTKRTQAVIFEVVQDHFCRTNYQIVGDVDGTS